MKKVPNTYKPYTKWASRSMSGQKGSPDENVVWVKSETCFWAIWDVGRDGDITFRFDAWKGQGQIKLRQILVFKFFFQKHTNLLQFWLRIPEMPSTLTHDNLKCQKLRLKSDVISFTFFDRCTAKMKDNALTFTRLLLAYSFVTSIPVFEINAIILFLLTFSL